MDDFYKNSALSRVLDSFHEMERMPRAISLPYDNLLSPVEHLTKNLSDMAGNTSRQLESIHRSMRSSVVDSALEAFARMNREIIATAQRTVDDSLPRFSRDISASLSEIATDYRDASAHIEEAQRVIARSVYKPIYDTALREALAAQSAWIRTVLAPRHDFYRMAEETRRLLRDALASLSDVDLASGEWEDEPNHEAEQQIEQARERIAATFESPNPQDVLQALGEYLEEAKSTKKKVKGIALDLFVNVIGGLLAAFMLLVISPTEPRSPGIVVKVKKEVVRIRNEGIRFPRDVRVVIASVLMVRSKPSRQSHTVGRLYAGDMVSVIKLRSRSWSLVEFQDQEGEIVIRGWVFTRYVVPLRSSRRYPRCRRRKCLR